MQPDVWRMVSDLHTFMRQNPGVSFFYTTDDDGVWMQCEGQVRINLGFTSESACEALAAALELNARHK